MTSHPSVRKLQLFQDDRLGAAESAAIAAHVERCPECQEALDRLTPFGEGPGTEGPDDGAAGDEHGPAPPPAARWPAVPGYEVLAELGRGGMGLVYKARHLGLDRVVALKMIRAEVGADGEGRKRFDAEARAVARLQHPNIVQIHDVGEAAGQPFLALEFVEGQSLAQRLDGHPWPAPQAAALAEVLARAMHYAHARGVIHRDLKPSNVLLAGPPEAPPERCVPKVTDFGLARTLDAAGETGTGAVLGTPRYMAPEQAEGRKGVGPPADVYGLGAILYELLTGRPPFRAESPLQTLRQVAEAEPDRPRLLNPAVPRDLETVCLKCLRKEPGKRYATALELAEDLRRILAGEPVAARPVGALERGWRWARRRPALALLLAVLLLAPLAAVVSLLEHNRQLREALGRAERGERAVRGHLYVADIRLAWQAWQTGDMARFQELLARCEPDPGAPPEADLRGFEWYYLRGLSEPPAGELVLRGHRGGACCVRYAPDGSVLASGGRDGRVKLWDARTGRELRALEGHGGDVNMVAFSPDGALLASAGDDRTARVWDVRTGRVRFTLTGHPGRVYSVLFSGDGRLVITAGEGRGTCLWDARTGRGEGSLPGEAVSSLALSPRGGRLVIACRDQPLRFYDLAARTFSQSPGPRHRGQIDELAFSPDGETLASASRDHTGRLWSVRAGAELAVLRGHLNAVHGVAFAPDGRLVATAGRDTTVRLWDLEGNPQVLLRGHTDCVWSVAFAPAGTRLASASADGTVRLWNHPERLALRRGTALGDLDRAGRPPAALSPDGRALATACATGAFRLLDVKTGRLLAALGGPADAVHRLAVAPDGRHVATANSRGEVRIWDLVSRQPVGRFAAHSNLATALAFSPDGRVLACYGADQTPRLWDWKSGRLLARLTGHRGTVRGLAFRPDGRALATASSDATVRLWDVPSGRPRATLRGHVGGAWGVAFSPDGRVLVTAGEDRTIKRWGADTGEELDTHGDLLTRFRCLAFSPDGRTLVSGGADGTVKLWQASTGQELLTLNAPDTQELAWAAFSPDGRLLATAGAKLSLWHAGGPDR
jgi:WD40 repeat protein